MAPMASQIRTATPLASQVRPANPPLVVSISESARLLGVSKQTIYDWNKRGLLPIIKLANTKRSVIRFTDLMELLNVSSLKASPQAQTHSET